MTAAPTPLAVSGEYPVPVTTLLRVPIPLAVDAPSDGAIERLEAVLFDMDGTLIDSEPMWWVAMDRVAAQLGGTLIARAAGKRRPDCRSRPP